MNTIDQFVRDVNRASKSEIAAWRKQAAEKAADFRLSGNERVTWRLMLRLLNSELKRY